MSGLRNPMLDFTSHCWSSTLLTNNGKESATQKCHIHVNSCPCIFLQSEKVYVLFSAQSNHFLVKMKECYRCKATCEDFDKFCHDCGTSLRFCKLCGYKLDDFGEFAKVCEACLTPAGKETVHIICKSLRSDQSVSF